MTNRAEFERLLDVYGFRCERFGQDLSTHARAQVVSAFAALAGAPVADVPLTHRCANCGAVFQGAGCPSCRLAAPVASAPVAEPGTMEEIHRQERERSPWVLPKDPTLPDSAPVAGEAKNYPGENVAERLDNMADDQPPGSQAQSDLYAAATIWRKHIAHRAAPQASEAVYPDTDIVDLAREGVQVNNPGSPEHTVCAELVRIAAALSAQPGAQRTGGGE